MHLHAGHHRCGLGSGLWSGSGSLVVEENTHILNGFVAYNALELVNGGQVLGSTSGSHDRLLGCKSLILILVLDLEEVLLVMLGCLSGELDLQRLVVLFILIGLCVVEGRHVSSDNALGAVCVAAWLGVVIGDQGTLSWHHCLGDLVLTNELFVPLFLSLEGEDLLAEAEQSGNKSEESADATDEVLDVDSTA